MYTYVVCGFAMLTFVSCTIKWETRGIIIIIIIIIIINSHIGHCAHSTGSDNVKVQNIFHGRNNITCSTDCEYRTAATPYTLDTRFVSGI